MVHCDRLMRDLPDARVQGESGSELVALPRSERRDAHWKQQRHTFERAGELQES